MVGHRRTQRSGSATCAEIEGRTYDEEDTRLENLLVDGLKTGGDDIPLTRQFWKDLKLEAMELAKKHQRRKKNS